MTTKTEKMVKVRAIHSLIVSNQRHASPGAEIQVTEAEARDLSASGAAELIGVEAPKPAPAPAPAPESAKVEG